jgi:gas vesicle protein
MSDEKNFQDLPPSPKASSEESVNDSRTDLGMWRDFYYRDGRHESDINCINRQLTVIQTETTIIKSDIAKVREELKSDIANVREELKSDMSKLKEELKSDMSKLREELKSDMSNLKEEFKSDISKLKEEFKSDMTIVKDELKSEMAEIKSDMAVIKTDIAVMMTKFDISMSSNRNLTVGVILAFLAVIVAIILK